jgi:hypothetical protein
MLSPVDHLLVYFFPGECSPCRLLPINEINRGRRLEVGPHVNGKTSAVHKSFRSELDAYLWLQAALLKGLVQLIN